MQVPFVKNTPFSDLTSPKRFTKVIHKPTTAPGWKIAKIDSPGPGSYDCIEAEKTTQKHRLAGPVNSTSKRTTFTDNIAKLTKTNPGLGFYKEVDSGFNQTRWGTFDTLKK